MPVLATPDTVSQVADELRHMSLHLRDIHHELTTRSRALKWEGGGVDQFRTQLDHADRGFTHCVDVLEEVVSLLGRAGTELAQDRNALVHAEQFVMGEAMRPSRDPGVYFHSLGWMRYPVLPPRFSTEWEDLALRAGYRP